jgi:endonuclease YncB( thermonuclease family)
MLNMAILLSTLWATRALTDVEFIEGMGRAFRGDVVIVDGAKIRLFGITAPGLDDQCGTLESNRSCGDEAKKLLATLVSGNKVVCRLRNKVGHGYWQGTCSLDGADIAETIVRAGWARAAVEMTDQYVSLEQQARAAEVGIWQKAN